MKRGLDPTPFQTQCWMIPGEGVFIQEEATQCGHHTGILA